MTIDDLYSERARLMDADDAGTITPSQRERLAEVERRIAEINRERVAALPPDPDLVRLRSLAAGLRGDA